MSKKRRVWSRALKLSAVKRMLAGENTTALAKALKVHRPMLYRWRDSYRRQGAKAFPGHGGRPPTSPRTIEGARQEAANSMAAAQKRIAELERKIGQQQIELDFFQQALRQVGPQSGSGAKTSTPSSKR
jgi:transposase-like protein